jgi:hypothetical protein
MDADLLDTSAAADLLGLSAGTLINRRSQRLGPPFVRLPGMRSVRYRRCDLEQFIRAGRVRL